MLCNSGEINIQAENDYFTLKSGQAFLHKPNEYHNISSNNTISSVAILTFTSNSKILLNISHKVLVLSEEQKAIFHILINESTSFLQGRNYSTILNAVPKSSFAEQQYIKNYLEIFLINCCRALQQNYDEQKQEEKYTLNKKIIIDSIINIIKSNLDKKLSLSFLADQTGYTISYITKIFKKYIGVSIIRYIICLKIKEAIKLMTDEKKTIKEISDILGFDSVQYFYRQFKNVIHMTPSDYMKSIKISNMINTKDLLSND